MLFPLCSIILSQSGKGLSRADGLAQGHQTRVLGACKMRYITASEFWTRTRAERAAEPAAKTAWPALNLSPQA